MIDLKALWEEEESKRIQDFLDNKRFSSSAILRYQTGDPTPKKPLPISDLKEFERRNQLYNDSLHNYMLSETARNEAESTKDMWKLPDVKPEDLPLPGQQRENFIYTVQKFKDNQNTMPYRGYKNTVEDSWDPEAHLQSAEGYTIHSDIPKDWKSSIKALGNSMLNFYSLGRYGTPPTVTTHMIPKYTKPVQPVFYDPQVTPKVTQPQKPAVEKRTEQTIEQPQTEIRPRVIVKRLDTTGNVVGQDTVSPSSVNRRFDADTKSWKQYQNGNPNVNYRYGGKSYLP